MKDYQVWFPKEVPVFLFPYSFLTFYFLLSFRVIFFIWGLVDFSLGTSYFPQDLIVAGYLVWRPSRRKSWLKILKLKTDHTFAPFLSNSYLMDKSRHAKQGPHFVHLWSYSLTPKPFCIVSSLGTEMSLVHSTCSSLRSPPSDYISLSIPLTWLHQFKHSFRPSLPR